MLCYYGLRVYLFSDTANILGRCHMILRALSRRVEKRRKTTKKEQFIRHIHPLL